MQTERLTPPPNVRDNRTTAKMPISEIFSSRNSVYLNEFKVFLAHFYTIPNFICEDNIDCKKANNWFSDHYRDMIKDHHYNRLYFGNNKQPELDDIFYVLYEDLLVNFDVRQGAVRFLFRNTDISQVERVIGEIRRFRKRKRPSNPEICLLVAGGLSGLETQSLGIRKPRLRLTDNYNDDLTAIHQTIVKRLSRKNDKGLVLLHGKPGTGKTSYIRYLITSIKKDVIFLPSSMAGSITDPTFISILAEKQNSILVIEDAEDIVMDRETNSNSPVSALLNISDGLLADCLNIQIICTFNTDLSRIDSALLRKGRLIAQYEFRELEIDKAQQLSDKLGFKSNITKPMTLTEIYNQADKAFGPPGRKTNIGFRTSGSI